MFWGGFGGLKPFLEGIWTLRGCFMLFLRIHEINDCQNALYSTDVFGTRLAHSYANEVCINMIVLPWLKQTKGFINVYLFPLLFDTVT